MDFKIGGHEIAQHGRPYIIAEIGQAHEGSVSFAEVLIQEARRAGVDAVKWQYHIAAEENQTRFRYWRSVEFNQNTWQHLRGQCREAGLDFIMSCFSLAAVERAKRLDLDAWKIPSAPHWPERIAACDDGKPIILSTGMNDWAEIDAEIDGLRAPAALMQCTSLYPTPLAEVGLNCIEELRRRFGLPVGLSDHSGSIWPSVAAMALGAPLIEVHLCLSRSQRIPDAASSLEWHELRMLASARDAITEMMAKPVDKDAMAKALFATRQKYAPPVKVA